MTDRWLVALDVDGTILLEDGTPSPGVAEAVARVRDAGHEVTIATGRSWSATEEVLNLLELTPEYVVCSNGAVILRRTIDGAYERDHVETFDASEVLTLLRERLPDAKYMVELGDGLRLYTHDMDEWNITGGRKVSFEGLSELPVSRVVAISPGHDEDDFHRIVSEAGLNDVSYAIGWTAWLDIAPQGIDKGTALARVQEALNLPAERVLVAGDGRNDIGMFQWAKESGGRAVAMGQAPAEVIEAAAEMTGDVASGGLATVLDDLAARRISVRR